MIPLEDLLLFDVASTDQWKEQQSSFRPRFNSFDCFLLHFSGVRFRKAFESLLSFRRVRVSMNCTRFH